MNFSLKRNLLIGFGISLLLLIVSSTASYVSIRNLLKSSELVSHTNEAVKKTDQVLAQMLNAETGQRGFLLTGQPTFLEPYQGSYEEITLLVNELKKGTSNSDVQQKNLAVLEDVIKKRFVRLQALIDAKKAGATIDVNDMVAGKQAMDSIRMLLNLISTNENALLRARTQSLMRFSQNTPILIFVAALLAIIITIAFFIKTNSDINARNRLQDELVKTGEAVNHRIELIKSVSDQISGGDYSVRVDDTEADGLGNISVALNKMASSLESAFNDLAEKEWLQTGIAGFNDELLGEENLQSVSKKIISFVAEYSNSQVGAIYIRESEKELLLENGYALQESESRKSVAVGEGIVGECAASAKTILLTNVDEESFNISFAAGEIKPSNIIAFPATFENSVKAVIELGALHAYTQKELEFFRQVGENIGISINTVQSRQRLQELLEETQSQSEELMAQQSELEQTNAELELQTQQLQTSEEELKVQSEELIEANTLLEEKSSILEERNQLIQQKNADIERKAHELALSTKYKSEFLANMSHELRTPLNSILLLSRLMSENNEKNLTADQVQYANVIQSSGKGLLQLIDEILDLSKIESGKMTIELQPVRITEMVDDLQRLFEPVAQENKLEWKINIGEQVPPSIETDRLRLDQILKNLLIQCVQIYC